MSESETRPAVETSEEVEILAPGTIVAIVDPLCGWCWGAAPALARIEAAGLPLVVLASGLFIGDRPMTPEFAEYAWKNDRRIAELTGQVFSEAYRDKVLGDFETKFDSGPATLALATVQLRAPQKALAVLHALQAARWVDGRNVTDEATCAAVLRETGIAEDVVEAFLAEEDGAIDLLNQRAALARELMSAVGARGVPTVLRVTQMGIEPVDPRGLFEDVDGLVARLVPAAGNA
jgi:putative protein-disulfide isomerase